MAYALFATLAAMSLLLLLMAGWILVQRAARRVAEQHPECGPFRLVGGGCGGHGHDEACDSCADASCKSVPLI
jgi:hypothetical protein